MSEAAEESAEAVLPSSGVVGCGLVSVSMSNVESTKALVSGWATMVYSGYSRHKRDDISTNAGGGATRKASKTASDTPHVLGRPTPSVVLQDNHTYQAWSLQNMRLLLWRCCGYGCCCYAMIRYVREDMQMHEDLKQRRGKLTCVPILWLEGLGYGPSVVP